MNAVYTFIKQFTSLIDLTADVSLLENRLVVVPINRFFKVLTKEQRELQLSLDSQRRHTENLQKQLEISFARDRELERLARVDKDIDGHVDGVAKQFNQVIEQITELRSTAIEVHVGKRKFKYRPTNWKEKGKRSRKILDQSRSKNQMMIETVSRLLFNNFTFHITLESLVDNVTADSGLESESESESETEADALPVITKRRLEENTV